MLYRRDLTKADGRKLFLYAHHSIDPIADAPMPLHRPFKSEPHLRWHPLRGEWVVYATHRQNRTFLPPKEYSPLAVTSSPEFPTELPAGNYEVAVFENLFPSLSPSATEHPDLFVPTQPARGACEVVVYTQNPETSFGALPLEQIKLVIDVWADRFLELCERQEIKYVMPFENRGVEVGVTLHHPHGQIYAYPSIPPLVSKMLEMQEQFFIEHKKVLLDQFLRDEESDGRRLIVKNENAAVVLPVCARYPYETWVMPRRRVSWLHELNEQERLDLAKALKTILLKYDKLWARPFPYLLLLFQAPCDGGEYPYAMTHFQIFPPYRSRERLKFLAGTELGAGFYVNDSLPEEKAAELKAVEVDV